MKFELISRESRLPARSGQQGFSLIEVLVTIVILLIGLLGLAGLQGRAFTTQVESYQRSQALILLKDMADRIEANRKNAAAYVGTVVGVGQTCAAGTTVAQNDLCEWHNALIGAAEGGTTGAMMGALGCVYEEIPAASGVAASGVAATYQVVVSWQGLNRTAAPNVVSAASPGQCGLGQYKNRNQVVDETLHRAIAIPVSVAKLD